MIRRILTFGLAFLPVAFASPSQLDARTIPTSISGQTAALLPPPICPNTGCTDDNQWKQTAALLVPANGQGNASLLRRKTGV
jgi:hypothetical protein